MNYVHRERAEIKANDIEDDGDYILGTAFFEIYVNDDATACTRAEFLRILVSGHNVGNRETVASIMGERRLRAWEDQVAEQHDERIRQYDGGSFIEAAVMETRRNGSFEVAA